MSTPPNYNYGAFGEGQPAPQVPPAPVRPAAVERGFWLLIATAVLSLVGVIASVVMLSSDDFRNDIATQTPGVSEAELDTAVTIGITTAVIVGLISVAVAVLFAVFARKGHNWARIVITVFAVFSLLNLLGVDGSLAGIMTLVSVVLTIVAVVLFYTKPASAYFAQMKQYRQAKNMGFAS